MGTGARSRIPLALAGVVLLTLVLRVVLSRTIADNHVVDADTPSYLSPGLALIRHGRFTWGPDSHVPQFFRTPGYPLFLGLLSRVVGSSARSLATAQAVLSTVTVVGVFALTRRWFGSAAIALGAATLAAFEPLQIWSSTVVLTEALTAALYVALALVATWACRAGSWRRWAAVSAVLAVATYVRPTTYYFPIVLALVLLVPLARRHDTGGWRRAAVGAVALVVPFAALVGPWQVRNHQQTGSWRLSGVEGMNMLDYRAAAVVADTTHVSYARARANLDFFFNASYAHERQGVYYDKMFDEGLRIVRAHPRSFLVTTARGTFGMVFGVKHVVLDMLGLPEHGPTVVVAEIGLVAFYLLAGVGIAGVVRRRRSTIDWPAHVLVLALVVYTVVAAGNPRATARLRAPLMPLLCPYVAAGAAVILARLRAPHPSHTDGDRPPTTAPDGAVAVDAHAT